MRWTGVVFRGFLKITAVRRGGGGVYLRRKISNEGRVRAIEVWRDSVEGRRVEEVRRRIERDKIAGETDTRGTTGHAMQLGSWAVLGAWICTRHARRGGLIQSGVGAFLARTFPQ